MPLFQLPPAPTVAPNTTATVQLVSLNGTIPAGTLLFSVDLPYLVVDFGFNGLMDFSNAGTVWARGIGAQAFSLQNLISFGNSGAIVAEASGGTAVAITVNGNLQGLTNTGGIYAVAQGGTATAIEEWGGATTTNSGIIAARSSIQALAIRSANGGVLINQVGGEIIAEGPRALAYSATFATIVNDGRIAAVSTDGSSASVGILLAGSGSLTNSGTIQADWVFVTNDFWYTPTQLFRHVITNELSGQLFGNIWTGLGNDDVINRGNIDGSIGMGEGEDLVDNSTGRILGMTDLGFGNDRYLGGAEGDFVFGDRGNDEIHGGAGYDLLVGGRGNDLLAGGSGADGLYGDFGNDRIQTLEGDRAIGGAGDDRIELGDFAFALADGGEGFDTLTFAAGARAFDLATALATARLIGFEAFELGGDKTLTVRAGDPTTLLSSGGSLWISGLASDTVVMAGNWALGTQAQRGGVTYQAYQQGQETVWISLGINVSSVASAVSGNSGLDAIGNSLPAPQLGSHGVTTSVSAVFGGLFDITSPLVIEADEHWTAEPGSIVVGGGGNAEMTTFQNYGRLSSDRYVVSGRFLTLDNYGIIEVNSVTGTANLAQYRNALQTYGALRLENIGSATAITVDLGGPGTSMANFNTITVNSQELGAIGISSYMLSSFVNTGTMAITSRDLAAIGISAHNGGNIDNSGTISASGAVLAYGIMLATFQATIHNTGTITARATEAGSEAVGIYGYWQSGINRIYNDGLIDATVAIRTTANVNGGATEVYNTGQIIGAIEFHFGSTGGVPTDDAVFNSGSINGVVHLGGGNDIYDGTGGQQTGRIYGDEGMDRLTGTAGADTMDGGSGDDILWAGSGDTLIGGTGNDIFAFAAPAAQVVHISDFQRNADRINLSDFAPTSITISGNRVTAQNALGTLVIELNVAVTMADIIVDASTFIGTSNADMLVAGASGTILVGLDGDDLLYGMAGNDRLDGGNGNDLMIGGRGDDTYVVGQANFRNDRIVENAGEGYDTVEIEAGQWAWYMPENIERAIGGNVVGNALDNMLIGSTQADSLNGGIGADRMSGLAGNDYYHVDNLGDLVFENTNEGIDTVASAISLYLWDNIENLQLSSTAGGFAVGNALDNDISGNSGADLLLGGMGNDYLHGSFGNDVLFGEVGDDHLDGGRGIDYLDGGIGNDLLEGFEGADALYGGDGNDQLYGDFSPSSVPSDPYAGASGITFTRDFVTDILVGGAGSDLLHGASGLGDYDLLDGGSGDDTYWVDTGDDLTFEAVGGGDDTVHADVRVANAGVYLWANVENLVLEGTTAFGVGNELDNILTGSASGNWLLGGLGADVIIGAGGNDVLFGESGSDLFVFGANSGADVIGDFVRGADRIQLNGLYADFAALSANFAQVGNDGAIYLPGSNVIVLHGVTMSALTAADFIFVPAADGPVIADKAPAVMDQPDWTGDSLPGIEPLLADPAELGLQRWGEPLPGQHWSFV